MSVAQAVADAEAEALALMFGSGVCGVLRSGRAVSFALALVAFLTLGATAAQGQSGSGLLFDASDGRERWQQRVVTVDGSRVAGMGVDVRAVLDAWSVAGLRFVEVEPGAPADVTMWRTSFSIPVAGRATRELDEAGTIVGCKLEVDATRPADGFNQVIVAHEFGHCLGLGHADEDGGPSLMVWQVESAAFSLEVAPADVAALRGLYR